VIMDANDQPRITDFGVAKRLRGDFGVTVTGQVIGSPNFMPPEQTAAKTGKVGPWSDVYGIGAILYYLLTGRPPFQAETIEEVLLLLRDADAVSPRLLNPSVPRDLETICLKCLEKDPDRRYASSTALADELKRFLSDEPIEARPSGPLNKTWRWCRRRPAIAALSVSVLLLLVIMAFGSTIAAWRVDRARRAEQSANRDLRQSISLLELERAEDFFNAHEAVGGVAYLAAMLRRDPSDSTIANRLVSALVHRRWAAPSTLQMWHAGRVISASFGPDGRHVLTASWDHTACLWDVARNEQVARIRHDDIITCAQFSPDGSRFITASDDGTARVWDVATGAAFTPALSHSKKIYWAEFSPDGRWIVTASADRGARIWDASNGGLKHALREHTSHLILARFSPDSKRVATGGSHGSIRIWSVDSGEMLFHV